MNYFFLLMIIYITYMLFSYIFFEAKLISPSFVFATSFSIMISLAYLFKEVLGFDVSKLTFSIFVIAGFLFIFTEAVVKIFYSSVKAKRNKFCNCDVYNQESYQPLCINRQMENFIFFFILFSLIFAIIVIYINTNEGTLGNRMLQYKNTLLKEAGSIKLRFIISQLYKINTAVIYLIAYVFIYNLIICNIKIKKQKVYILAMITFCFFSAFAQGARQPAIELIIFLPIVYISLKMKPKEKKNVRKLMVKLIPILALLVIGFYYSSTLVGRRQTQRGILEYLAVYFCGGLYSFNLHVNQPARTLYWGQSSFADIYLLLINIGIVPSTANMAYRDFDLYGNTVTMFGRWYEDFGSAGVFIMSILVSLFFSQMFYRKNSSSGNQYMKLHLGRIVYCKFLISLVWAGYDDRIRALISLQTVVVVVIITLLYWLLIKKNFHFKFV